MAWEEVSSTPGQQQDREAAEQPIGTYVKTVVIDDSDAMRRTLMALLRNLPVEIVGEAADGDEGLRVCRDAQPDLVFLDIMMPGKTGLEALREIKEACPASRVIMLTSMAERSAVMESAKLGAHDYLLKPFNRAVLHDRVQAICRSMIAGEDAS